MHYLLQSNAIRLIFDFLVEFFFTRSTNIPRSKKQLKSSKLLGLVIKYTDFMVKKNDHLNLQSLNGMLSTITMTTFTNLHRTVYRAKKSHFNGRPA